MAQNRPDHRWRQQEYRIPWQLLQHVPEVTPDKALVFDCNRKGPLQPGHQRHRPVHQQRSTGDNSGDILRSQ